MKDGFNSLDYLTYLLPGWLVVTAIIFIPPPLTVSAPPLLDKEIVGAFTWLLVAYTLGHLCGWWQTKLFRQKDYIVRIWDDPALTIVSEENRRAAFSVFAPYYPKLLENLGQLSGNPAFATGLFNLVEEYNFQQGINQSADAIYGGVQTPLLWGVSALE